MEKSAVRTVYASRAVLFVALAMISMLFACVPPDNKPDFGKAEQDFSSEKARAVYLAQDRQDLDSLIYFIESPDPMLRFCATRAFGSFVTPEAVPYIRARLKDSIFEIRAEAAYVAGQLRDTTLAEDVLAIFEADKNSEVDHELNLNVLESIGKIGPEIYHSFLSSSSSYPKSYQYLNAGRAHAFYQYALRGITNEKSTQEMVKFVTNDYPTEAAVMAANYLHRAKDINLDPYKFQLLQALKSEKDPNIRMALATAVGKTAGKDILIPFIDHLRTEKDSRVIVNGIRQFNNFKYIQVIDYALSFLSHRNESVALTAASYLRNHGQFGDAGFYLDYVAKTNNPKVKRAIKGSILKLLNRNFASTRRKLERELLAEYESAKNPYEQADVVAALGSNPYLFQTVIDLCFVDTAALVVKSKGIEALGSILTEFLPDQTRTQQRYLAPIVMKSLNRALGSKDPGMIAAAAYSLSTTEVNLVKNFISIDSLTAAKNALTMPNDIEAINYCIEAINKHFPASKLDPMKADYAGRLNKKSFESLSANMTATISTTRGDVILELYGNHAPSTVVNFIDLAQQNYFSNKFFHRVVPNFVIQAGCPRGDGYGSEDFTIRSELSPLRYLDEGYVGMASAGKHTEGTQWFITHSPTPHLSGNYTIFAKVKDGMEVVHKMKVGDKILNVNVINNIHLENIKPEAN